MKPQRGKGSKKRNANSPFQEPVEVFCRIRPLDDPNDPVCAKPLNNKVVQLVTPEGAAARNGQVKEYQYTYQHVFDEFSSQKDVYDNTALPLVEDLVAGKSGLLFTYGITGSGKTYTMTGTPQDQGILPRCLDVLFNSIGGLQTNKYVFKPDRMNGFEVQTEADAMMERQKKDIMPNLTTPSKTPSKQRTGSESGSDTERVMDPTTVGSVEDDNNYAVFVSYIEIYNNYVYDLLDDLPYNPITGYKPPQTKILRTDSSDNMYVHNCTETEVKKPQDAIDAFYKGQKRRKVAQTILNAESSRSHSVFNIRLVQAPLDARGEEVIQAPEDDNFDQERICVSQLSLVDLAGSERTNRTKNSGDRLKEANQINQSLMVLRNCLEILRDNGLQSAPKLVPYRDSRLTHLFKTFFDGEGKVRMIICINPKVTEYEETIHVMKFAEMTQEVLITKAVTCNKFDVGLTPGRRRNRQEAEAAREEEEILSRRPHVDFSIGPPFPVLELVHPTDNQTLGNIGQCLEERVKRRQLMILDYEHSCTEFRVQLLEFEKDYNHLRNKCSELEEKSAQREKENSRLDNKVRGLERRLEDMSRAFKDMEKENTMLGLQVQDKQWKIQVEKNSKEKLKSDYRNRLQLNNQTWEKNLEKAKRQFVIEAEDQLDERDRKLDMLRDIVNENDANVVTPRTRGRVGGNPTPKPRTQTTPASIYSASSNRCDSDVRLPMPDLNHHNKTKRSETDMTSVGASTLASSARMGRPGNTRIPPRSAVRIPSAKSIPNLSQVGLTPSSSRGRQPVVNPRYHRRSKSSGNAEVWIDHKPNDVIDTNTIMQPKMGKKRSVSRLDVKDTKSASKYVLTHQEQDSSDELVTKLIKGDVKKTQSGGSSVVFHDVETLSRISPGSRKRRSPTYPMYDPDLHFTDTEERCSTALEGHKRSRTTNL